MNAALLGILAVVLFIMLGEKSGRSYNQASLKLAGLAFALALGIEALTALFVVFGVGGKVLQIFGLFSVLAVAGGGFLIVASLFGIKVPDIKVSMPRSEGGTGGGTGTPGGTGTGAGS